MEGLAALLGLEKSRAWWPNYLFRSDHVENAATILNKGVLLSRLAAEKEKLIIKDSGSPEHISQLDDTQRNLVRLYFRPRAPTNYVNEGFRPTEHLEYQAHMPVPVYLLFSSVLLSQQGVRFSKGRLTPQAEIGDTSEFLNKMNFAQIYHDRQFRSPDRSSILNARHSEVLVESELSLSSLKHIVCRSLPERETLLSLLQPKVAKKWLKRIHVDVGHRRLFERRGTFVTNTHLSSDESAFTFYSNMDSKMRGPYDLRVIWALPDGTGLYRKEVSNFMVPNDPVKIRLPGQQQNYTVKLTLNKDLAYRGRFRGDVEEIAIF